MSKKVALFGATGKTGLHLITQALKKGHQIKAIVRNVEKLKTELGKQTDKSVIENKNLEIVHVDNIFDSTKLAPQLTEVDVVMSTLGFGRGSTGYVDFTKAVTEALNQIDNGCRRLIFMHSAYSEPTSRAKAPWFIRWTLFAFIGPILDNMREAEKYLEQQKDMNYTVVLPGGLKNGPETSLNFQTKEDWCIEGVSTMIQRADVARFMIKTMEEDSHHGKIIAIAMQE